MCFMPPNMFQRTNPSWSTVANPTKAGSPKCHQWLSLVPKSYLQEYKMLHMEPNNSSWENLRLSVSKVCVGRACMKHNNPAWGASAQSACTTEATPASLLWKSNKQPSEWKKKNIPWDTVVLFFFPRRRLISNWPEQFCFFWETHNNHIIQYWDA